MSKILTYKKAGPFGVFSSFACGPGWKSVVGACWESQRHTVLSLFYLVPLGTLPCMGSWRGGVL